MKPENCKKTAETGEVKCFMVEYKRDDGEDAANSPHNQYFFLHYDDAMRKYMHLVLDQITEKTLIRVVRFRKYNEYHGKYITIFESRVFHQACLYDTESHHHYVKGKVPIAPKVEWRGGELF